MEEKKMLDNKELLSILANLVTPLLSCWLSCNNFSHYPFVITH